MSSKATTRIARPRTASCVRSISNFLDTLERRQMFNATPFVLSGGALTQDWSNTSLITTDDLWTGVPSFEGYRGDALTGATGANPQSIVGTSTVLDVNANQTNPDSFATGGVTEFQTLAPTHPTTANPTIGLSGSGTADAPYLVSYLNTTGTNSVRVQYLVRDLEVGADDAIQQLALQYRVGGTGSWIDVPAGYIADATTTGATPATTVRDVTLPAGADNQSLVEVRWLTTNAVGNDEAIGIDDINISAIPSNTAGVFSFEQSAYTVSEGVGSATFTVRRLGGTVGAVSVAYATLNGTAIAPDDYTATSNVLNFADGVSSLTFTVPIIDDAIVDAGENFSISLSSPTGGAAIGSPSTTTVNITDNEVTANFVLEQSSYTVSEGAGTASFIVRRVGGTSGTASVSFSTANGTAVAPGDYTTSSGTLNFLNGVETLSFSVPIINDTDVESSENFTIALSNPTNGVTLGSPNTATVTITDNDVAGTLAFNPTTYTVAENGGSITLTVERTLGTSGAVSVAWATLAGTATHPDDFVSNSGVLNFANGETSKTIVIQITDDAITEGIEQFTVTLSSPGGGALLGSAVTATVIINDNDTNGPAGLLLNEIGLNPPSTDLPYQFVELRGTPGLLLENIYLLELEGDTAQNPGKINSIVPLGGATIGSNGLLLIRSSSGFTPESAATGVFNTPLFDVGGIDFQPGSASFVLFYDSGTFSLTVGTDLDTLNAGTLTLPTTASALDVVGVLDGSNNDKAYGAVLPAYGTNLSPDAPDGLARFYNNVTPNAVAAWFYGNLVGTSDSKTFTSVAAQRSTNFPAGGVLTPGGAMTGVVSAVLDYAGASQSIVITFSEDIGASLAASDFELINLTTSTTISLTLDSVSPDGTVARLKFTNTAGITSSLLADGDYQLRVKAGEVGDGTNVLPIDSLSPFFFKNADFNHDRSVNFDDLLLLAQNYGTATGATFSGGDANYDGKVDFDDLLLLAQRYGTTLVTVAPAKSATTAAKKRTGFSDSVIA